MAAQSLLNGECDMALAGGVTMLIQQDRGYLYKENEILSADGHCRAFDARSKGTVFGSGVGVVVLKRLTDAIEDGDTIHAVLIGSAINNDGSGKAGYLAPSVDGQAKAIAEALAVAGVTADAISFVEAHGTGTQVGDPIEVTALTQAFRETTDSRGFCALGSVKTNIGHLDTAAGVASLIKAIQSLKHKQIPPTLHFEKPNPDIDFERSPFFVNNRLIDWKSDGPRRAAVSSLGVGGTNAHIVIQEAPEPERTQDSRPWNLLCLSTRSAQSLEAATKRLAEHLRNDSSQSIADVAYTTQLGRKAFKSRRIVVCEDRADAIRSLESLDQSRVLTSNPEPKARSIAFMFTGQGAQYPGMGYGLYRDEPIYREQIDHCASLLEPLLGIDIRRAMYPENGNFEEAREQLNQTWLTQPALFVTEYALARLWMEWGVEPQAMLGHSIGEYVAACIAGVFTLEDALRLVAARGRMTQQLPGGSMWIVPMPEEQVKLLLNDGLSLAAVNAPELCVVSGRHDAIDSLAEKLNARGISGGRLQTSHAFHSSMLDPILRSFAEEVEKAQPREPLLPFVSNVTGTWITPDEATSSSYWVSHLRGTVRFADGMSELLKDPQRVLLEVGPGRTLTTLAVRHSARQESHEVISSMRHPTEETPDLAFMLRSIGQLWISGVEIDWTRLHSETRRRRVPLPTYPFEHKRYWIEPGAGVQARTAETNLRKKADLSDWLYKPGWRELPATQTSTSVTESGCVFVFADEVGIAAAATEQMIAAANKPKSETEPVAYVVRNPGEVDSLTLESVSRIEPGPGEVEIEVHAAGIQFKDVLLALGIYPDPTLPLGIECAGKVVRIGSGVTEFSVGDEVISAGPGSMRTYVTRDVRYLVRKPTKLSFEDAATLPAAFLTAHYSLDRIGKLKPGESVLIHAAAGGVGLAAVQLAQRAGATIYATAGSREKREFLERLGVEHVFDSRTLDYADQIALLSHVGVDVVLNSLAGDHISRSLSLLKKGGRFLELGRADVYLGGKVTEIVKERGLFHSVIDMDQVHDEQPNEYKKLFLEIVEAIEDSTLKVLPKTVFDWTDAASAFQYMVAARQIGKIILSLDKPSVTCLSIVPGLSFAALGDDRFVINPVNEDDYKKLIEEVEARGSKVARVIHCWNVTRERIEDSNRMKSRDEGYFSLIHLARTLDSHSQHSIPVAVVSNRLQKVVETDSVDPEKSLLLGACRVIPREYPRLSFSSIDVCPNTAPNEVAQALLAQVQAESASLSAVRGTRRWEQTLDLVREEQVGNSTKPVKEGGVYLVTGGLGGIPFELAKHLSANGRIKLALINRSRLPAVEERPDWLRTHSSNDQTSQRIRQIEELESRGSEVLVLAADVADESQMASALDQVRGRFGKIDGVIHAAGVLDDGLIHFKTRESIDSVLRPKVDGALVLAKLLKAERLDFFVLFSSVSALLGLPGQVDYAAANSFLDAFAQRASSDGLSVTSIGWGPWKEVGLAVASGRNAAPAKSASHPLLDEYRETGDTILFTTEFSREKHWLLSEHVMRGGEALIPGTGYLELLRAAMNEIEPNRAIELSRIYFLTPFTVGENGTRKLELELQRIESEIELSVKSIGQNGEETHVTGYGRYLDGAAAPKHSIDQIKRRCGRQEKIEGSLPQKMLDFGPRWRNLKEIRYGKDEALARLEISSKFAAELNSFSLHPALLDIATACGQPLLQGFDWNSDFFVPFSYGSIRLRAPLPAIVYSHVRCRDITAKEAATFDVTLIDEKGSEIAEIRDFVMKRVESGAGITRNNGSKSAANNQPAATGIAELRDEVMREAILTAEGLEVFDQVLQRRSGPHVIVSPVSLPLWIEKLDALSKPKSQLESASTGSGAGKSDRPNLTNPYVEPQNEAQEIIAKLWQEILGVKKVGIHDNFFDLGGHSLLAVRLFTQLEKKFGKNLPLSTLFGSPTIELLSRILVGEEEQEKTWPCLVKMKEGTKDVPFILINAVGGNLLHYSELLKHFDEDQPVYGLQARGLDGVSPPHSTIEEMARDYIAEVKQVQPTGPYCVGGLSFGGLAAYEMAQQLHAMGEAVGLVALFDTYHFKYQANWSAATYLRFKLDQYYKRFKFHGSNVINGPDRWNYVASKSALLMKRIKSRAKYYRWRATSGYYRVLGKDLPAAITMVREANQEAFDKYEPKAYPGTVTLFRATKLSVAHAYDTQLAWRELALGGLEVHDLSGDHVSIMSEPQVRSLAEKLNGCIAKVQKSVAGSNGKSRS